MILLPRFEHVNHVKNLVITVVVLTTAAFLGGALNALAGGGTFVTFPALLFARRRILRAPATP